MNGRENAVRVLAYELWERAGRPKARDAEFWFAAEARLRETKAKPEGAIAVSLSRESKPDPVMEPAKTRRSGLRFLVAKALGKAFARFGVA